MAEPFYTDATCIVDNGTLLLVSVLWLYPDGTWTREIDLELSPNNEHGSFRGDANLYGLLAELPKRCCPLQDNLDQDLAAVHYDPVFLLRRPVPELPSTYRASGVYPVKPIKGDS